MRQILPLLLLSAIVLMPIHAQDNLPPYIYYYSNALNAFVIERADGSDSRLLGQDVIPRRGNYFIQGPGWSPDGNWLAWSGGGNHAIHVNGIDRLEILDVFANATMHWSPDSRWMLVSGRLNICSNYPEPCHYQTHWVIDVDSQRVVTSFDLRPAGLTKITAIEWGQEQVTFYSAEDLSDLQYYRITMDFAGSVSKQAISREVYNEVPFHDQYSGRERVLLDSPSGRYTGFAYDRTLTDTETGTSITLPLHSESASGSSPMGARWHPSEDWVLFVFNSREAPSPQEGYVTVMSLDGAVQREIAFCGFHTTCVNWLPDHIDLEQLPLGRPESMLPAPIHYDYDIALEYFPGEREPHLLVCDEATNLFNLVQDVATGEIVFTLDGENPCFRPDVTEHFPFALSSDGTIYARNARSSPPYTALYDVATGDLLAALPVHGWELSFSTDGSLLMMRSKNARITWDVQALLRSGERQTP